jgi:hypothetical protein
MAATAFEVSITEAEIADLRDRLRRTRWPEPEPVDDWSQGVPLAYAQELCRSWAEDYDFGFAKRVNVFPQYRDTIDGLGIHFLHVRSPEPDAFPLVLTHGWPGSVLEFLEVLGPLTDPRAHGGDPADAFHVVAPSLPGYGWSDKPSTTGWGISRIARAWDTHITKCRWSIKRTARALRSPGRLVASHRPCPLPGPGKTSEAGETGPATKVQASSCLWRCTE